MSDPGERRPLLLWLMESAEAGLELQGNDGAMPAGHNGPWNHVDTPVRTTAHWAILFYRVARLTSRTRFEEGARRACEFLLSKDSRPHGKAFFCREERGKDNANNLIGQAWAMEPLVEIGQEENDNSYLDCALEVARLHVFDDSANLWRRIDVDGSDGGFCWTLNQQIMFTAVVLKLARLTNEDRLLANCRSFFERFPRQTRWFAKGLPYHHIMPLEIGAGNKTLIRGGLRKCAEWLNARWWRKQAVGYMPFILYGLALAKHWNAKEDFWRNGIIDNMVQNMISSATSLFPYGYLESDSSFRWAYNPAGFEIAFASEAFDNERFHDRERHLKRIWAGLQLEGHFHQDQKLMGDSSCDPAVLSARIYEATRLPNWELEVSDNLAKGRRLL